MKSSYVTVVSLIESNNLTKYYRNDSQFIVRLRTSDNQWAGAGEEVKININGMIYTRYTNETGHAKLSINLIKGVYVVTTYYKDCRNSDTIVVLPTLITGDLEMKYHDGSSFIIKHWTNREILWLTSMLQ